MTVRPMRLVGMLAGGALFGKLLGFVRELEMARLIGAGALADSLRGALTAAQPMPNAAKTLQAPAYNLTFESWTPSSL